MDLTGGLDAWSMAHAQELTDVEREAAINDLINSYDNFNDVYENWEWFKQQAFNLINRKLW